jgi:peptide/nickel transport system substrate-binding protein
MTERQNYWLRKPISRRRVLYGAAGTTAGVSALALVGCGNDDDDDGPSPTPTPAPSNGETPPPSGEPQRGGSLSWLISTSPPTLDPYTQTSFLTSYVNGVSYSKLLRYAAGVPEVEPTDFTMEPDLAQTMPETPDQLTWVFKIKENAKFHDVEPTNGRALTSEDVAYSIDRYKNFDESRHRSLWAFVESVETPDAQTVRLNTTAPYADTVQIAGGNLGAYISPQEHAETDVAVTRMVGSGPFIHEAFDTDVRLHWRANPDYYDAPYPYVDETTVFIVTDQTQRVEQFISGDIDLTWIHLEEERDRIKAARPDAGFDAQQGIGSYIYLRSDRPPFNDKRVRQAISMGINREQIRQATSAGEGEPDQIVFVGYPFATKVADLGEPSKYWDYNPQEARALLDAAIGEGETIETTWDHADAAVYQQAYVDGATISMANLRDIGINIEQRMAPYAQYISTTYQGQYEGMGHSPRAVFYFLDYLTERLSFKDGVRARINLSYVDNPELETLLDRQRGQFDFEERVQTIREIEQICAEEQYEIYWSTQTRSYFWNPAVQNYRPTAWFPYTHLMKSWKQT